MGKPTPTATSIDSNVKTLERYSYVECDGQVAQRAKLCGAAVFSPSGLSIAGRISVVALSDSGWTALPTSPLTDRNAIAIQNQSDYEIKLNYDSGEAGYVGVIVPAGAERFYDITEDIPIYAKFESGGSGSVVVEELS